MNSESGAEEIICFGEVLWDALPSGLFLGGAPLNVAFHLHVLGERLALVSRVGNDRLGREGLRRIRRKGLDTGLIQTDRTLETGFVQVDVDASGNPAYEIIEPVAWDHIELTNFLERKLHKAWGVVFGSLAQRNEVTRSTIHTFFNSRCRKIFDINLREPFTDRSLVEESLKASQIVKLNEEELNRLAEWFSLPGSDERAVRKLADRFRIDTVCVTCGAGGAALLNEEEWAEHPGYDIQVADAVGAGDAFLAALLTGLRKGRDNHNLLAFANAAGALVATRYGATPDYEADQIEELVSVPPH